MRHLQLCPMVLGLLLVAFGQSAHCETVKSDVLRKGTRYETRYYVKTGGQPGPTVVLIGGAHGDEPAGYLAARKIAKWTITKGKLVVLPDAHREAIRRNVRGYPGNMNKMFPGKADGDDMERLAYSIWRMIEKSDPDLLLSLHESRGFHADEPERFGQTLTYDFHALDGYMQKALDRVNPSIEPRKHKFLLYAKPYATCPTYQAWARLKVPATGIETAKPLPLKTRVKYQMMMVQAFFDGIGLGYQQDDVPMLPTSRQAPDLPMKTAPVSTVKKVSLPKTKPAGVSPTTLPTANVPVATSAPIAKQANEIEAPSKGWPLGAVALFLGIIGAGVGFLVWKYASSQRVKV